MIGKHLNQCDVIPFCNSLSHNNMLITLNLYGSPISYTDIIAILNSSSSIQTINLNNIFLPNNLNLDLLLITLMNNTNITDFNMSDIDGYNLAMGIYTYGTYYPLDDILSNLLKNNTTLTSLNLSNNPDLYKCFKSYTNSILAGLQQNTTLVELYINETTDKYYDK